MMSNIAKARRVICGSCPKQCRRYMDGKIDHDDPWSYCGVSWKGQWPAIEEDLPVSIAFVPSKAVVLPATWAELHLRYLHHDGSDDSTWLMEDFTPRIRRIGCACMRHWLEVLNRIPPRWDDPFACSVEWHNEVNLRLDKPTLSENQARAIWFIAHDA